MTELPIRAGTHDAGRGRWRALACALTGGAVAAGVDYVATLRAYPAEVAVGPALRLVAVAATLYLILSLLAWPALALGARVGRLLGAGRPRDAGQGRSGRSRFLMLGAGAVVYAGISLMATVHLAPRFKEPQLTALLLAMVQVAIAGAIALALAIGARPSGLTGPRRPAGAIAWGVVTALVLYVNASTVATFYLRQHVDDLYRAAAALAAGQLLLWTAAVALGAAVCAGFAAASRVAGARLGRLDPFGRLAPALVLLVAAGIVAVNVMLKVMPQMRPLVPWRDLLVAIAFAGGAWAGAGVAPRPRLLRGPRRLAALAAAGALVAVVAPLTLVRWGAQPETKYMAVSSSPTMSRLIALVRFANDFDRDGYGSLLGENDCAPFDSKIHPGAREIPDNDIDENCSGRDFSLAALPSYRTGEQVPVPDSFQRDWNVLLLTVDTVRYDHTSFGGYIETSGRDTTPHLARLVDSSVSFSFANAPSAGTMASVPAILTSRFFHSGIALDEDDIKRGMPPRLAPDNTLISEVMKRAGYTTGAILTHEYFNDWGMEQGFDDYDNDLGAKPDPFKVTSDEVTDRAIAWVSRNAGKKWFLWAHYLDPHGRYVAHPGEPGYGSSEKDLYDGELRFTDKHVGRLLNELSRMPGADRTIVIITSDHGDGFNEHGFINHGMALYREMIHVPLIFYIPELPPREVPGAVSPIDILPTVADLCGIDVSDLHFEGESLVPQLFYDRDAHDRVVFSETNWPKPLRAAVTSRYKLIYNLKDNVYELYDLEADPWEKSNIAAKDRDGLALMKRYLDDWLERVYYDRDVRTNQAAGKLREYLLDEAPSPRHPVAGLSLDEGRIDIIGYDVGKGPYRAGDKVPVQVYFRVTDRPSGDFRVQVEAWLEGEPEVRPDAARSKLRHTGGGLFPTSRWRPGEHVRDRLPLKVPKGWRDGGTLVLGLRMRGEEREPVSVEGPTRPGHGDVLILGKVDLAPAGSAEPGEDRRR